MNTKEKILVTALRLFAVYGYEAVSVSRIAGELGITKGALYKHYRETFLTVSLNMSVSWTWSVLEKAAFRNRTTQICRKLFLMYCQKV